MKYLFMYDISEQKRLIKVHNILKKKGIRTQFSFFECELRRGEMLELFNTLTELLDKNEDKLFVISINKHDAEKIIRMGKVPKCVKGIF